MWERIKNEPAIITGVIVAALGVAVAFGVQVSDSQQASIVAAVNAVLVLLGAGVIRQRVAPTAKVDQAFGMDDFDFEDEDDFDDEADLDF